MNIPLVDLKAQYAAVRGEIDAAIQRVLDSQHFILGDAVRTFEEEFAAYVGCREAVGVASGTSALHLSLLALGVGAGDEVITTAHTFIATAEAVSHTGARPVFVDIDAATYTLDPRAVERAITSRTRAIMPVHLYGHPADLDALMAIAERHGIPLVEDAAQAHGAEYRGRRCGTVGHLACFSFYPGKNLGAYGDAGAVTGSDPRLLARVRKLRDHGRTTKYEHDEIGYGERLDSLQAAVLSAKLKHLERWTTARRAHAAAYAKLLAGAALTLPVEAPRCRSVYHLYVVRVSGRDRVLDALRARGIGAGVHYPVPLNRQPAYARIVPPGLSLPATERAAAEVLSLPMYPELTMEQIEYVAKTLREIVA